VLKKLRTSLLLKFTLLLFFTLFLLYLISYALLNKFMIESMKPEELTLLMDGFNEVWINILFVFIALFCFVFFILKHIISKVTDEIEDINNFLEEINKKNYDAVLKIEHHLEFLQLSLLLKNIVKRLKNKNR